MEDGPHVHECHVTFLHRRVGRVNQVHIGFRIDPQHPRSVSRCRRLGAHAERDEQRQSSRESHHQLLSFSLCQRVLGSGPGSRAHGVARGSRDLGRRVVKRRRTRRHRRRSGVSRIIGRRRILDRDWAGSVASLSRQPRSEGGVLGKKLTSTITFIFPGPASWGGCLGLPYGPETELERLRQGCRRSSRHGDQDQRAS